MAKSNQNGYSNNNDCADGICHVTLDTCIDIHATEEETSLNVQHCYRTPSTSGTCMPYQLTSDGSHLNDDFDLEQIPTFHTVSHSKGFCNTEHIYTLQLRATCCKQCRSCAYPASLLQLPKQLTYLEIPNETYSSALKHIIGSTKWQHYTLCHNKFLHAALLLLVIAGLWVSCVYLMLRRGLHIQLGPILFAVITIGVVFLLYISCGCIRRRVNYSSKCDLSKSNELLLRHRILCGLVEYGAVSCYSVNIYFLYFDPGPCLDRLIQVLNCTLVQKKRKNKTTVCSKLCCVLSVCFLHGSPSDSEALLEESRSMLENASISQTRQQDFAKTLLHHYSHRYVTSLIKGHMRKPFYERHVIGKLCLCQYIEREFFHFPLDSINTIS